MAATLWVDQGFEQVVRLANGRRALLRLIRPDDRVLLERGLARLSETSRYRRFLSATTTLSEAQLRYLTEVDAVNHLAIVAGRATRRPERAEGWGVARFVRSTTEPEVAEAAITVIDDFQGQGLGRILLAALSIAARERGIGWFRGEMLTSNPGSLALMQELDPDLERKSEGDITTVLAKLPDVPLRDEVKSVREAMRRGPANRLLSMAARGMEFSARKLGI